mgnify:CR=1 FL=1
MDKKKEKEKNPADALSDFIKKTGMGSSHSVEGLFKDVFESMDNMFKNSDQENKKK